MPPPTREDLTAATRVHLIGPFDKISVEVFGIQELSRTVEVDAQGQIQLPLIGVVAASGRTPPELASFVQQQLGSRYVRNPQVSVNVVETQSLRITVDGEVTQPGVYPFLGRVTLMSALAQAHGVTEYARQKHVVVFRQVNGQDMAALYDLRAIRRGIYADPEIYPNDIVVVGENQARRIFQDVLRSSNLLTTPIVAAIRR
ncbi:polysaccharide export protein [Sphingosinicella ginsenosidimutans]|uniref:Polysaccharide export protein n=1 Tax=Allosphingosinicella ginsenosidimutans TaxID=1176539 RepID=A0A5C6TZD6_9SPHN|nr:polysaccharide export protein [Sphingosinicella ginsenosidimutans]